MKQGYKVIKMKRLHPLGNMNVLARFYGGQPDHIVRVILFAKLTLQAVSVKLENHYQMSTMGEVHLW